MNDPTHRPCPFHSDPETSCDICDENGIVTGCYCEAREPFECCCGGWDDVDLDDWYNEEDWNE